MGDGLPPAIATVSSEQIPGQQLKRDSRDRFPGRK